MAASTLRWVLNWPLAVLASLAAQPGRLRAGPAAAPGMVPPGPVSPGVRCKTGSIDARRNRLQTPPGVPDDASAVTLELTSRPVAFDSAARNGRMGSSRW
jgi:hypothetical protein